ncbi:GNAT family N-acetyltransferase [Gordonia rubripertincta]|uniref:GNAT family N-acetyltransferase n=1 Tax=Gordonia rubripertincta TaxID=36822 RepID=UPI000B8D512F|nr:GNAT family N-acetyltransferase [Gordonia rubripertincta]ASR01470.1 Mycothiol acetyltransferase [Gordonia rubripertincta]
MITYEWLPRLDGDELDEVVELVIAAAEYDEEAGFSHIDPAMVRATGDGTRTIAHLPIKARRDLSPLEDVPMVVVAYLHLAVEADGLGVVSYVVHPEYRSRGITTLLVEEIRLDTTGEGGWAGTGANALRCWAYSTHPASGRLTRRFGIPAVGRQWTLIRHLTGPFALPLDKPDTPAGVTLTEPRELAADDTVTADVLASSELAPRHRDRVADDLRLGGGLIVDARNEDGQVLGFVWFSTEHRRHLELRAAPVHALVLTAAARGGGVGTALLLAALWHQVDADVQLSTLRIDPEDTGAVRMCRLLGYEQEDVHSCYQVGESAGQPPSFR